MPMNRVTLNKMSLNKSACGRGKESEVEYMVILSAYIAIIYIMTSHVLRPVARV